MFIIVTNYNADFGIYSRILKNCCDWLSLISVCRFPTTMGCPT